MTNLLCDSCHWYSLMEGETLTYTGLVREANATTRRQNTMQKLCFCRNGVFVAAIRHKLGTWTAGWFHVKCTSLATFRSYVNSQTLPESRGLRSGLGGKSGRPPRGKSQIILILRGCFSPNRVSSMHREGLFHLLRENHWLRQPRAVWFYTSKLWFYTVQLCQTWRGWGAGPPPAWAWAWAWARLREPQGGPSTATAGFPCAGNIP